MGKKVNSNRRGLGVEILDLPPMVTSEVILKALKYRLKCRIQK